MAKRLRGLKRLLLVILAALLLLEITGAQVASAQDAGFLYPFYDRTSRDCGPLGGGGLATDGFMSLRYPGFSDEAAMARTIEEFIRATAPNSPWLRINDFGNRFMTETKRLDVNPLMIVVIGRKESQFGTDGDSSLPRFNSFGDKSGSVYRNYGSWERSLFGGDGLTNDDNQSFPSRVAYRLSGRHSEYAGVTNMYEYISVHLTGDIYREGDTGQTVDDFTGIAVNLQSVIAYHNDAMTWIGEMTGQTITSTVGQVSDCNSTGVINGSIVQTALALAWTDPAKVAELMAGRDATEGLCTMEGGNAGPCGRQKAAAGALIGEADARPEYVQAVRQFNAAHASDGADWAFSDCGVFVATVMRASQVDPEYEARNTRIQLPYVRDNNPGYETVLFTDTSQLQPGDLLIREGHTAIYVGPNNVTNAVVVQASWGQHVPAANQSTVTPGEGYYRARRIL